MMQRLQQLIASVLSVPAEQLTGASGPATLPEWTSLAHVTIVAAVEEEFHVQFEMGEILNIKQLDDLARLLGAKGIQA
jgi:acyl carrier protein